jgi:hypothetical protein
MLIKLLVVKLNKNEKNGKVFIFLNQVLIIGFCFFDEKFSFSEIYLNSLKKSFNPCATMMRHFWQLENCYDDNQK